MVSNGDSHNAVISFEIEKIDVKTVQTIIENLSLCGEHRKIYSEKLFPGLMCNVYGLPIYFAVTEKALVASLTYRVGQGVTGAKLDEKKVLEAVGKDVENMAKIIENAISIFDK